ncbi:MAG: hypothetical protein ACYDHP_12420 [Ferrimicrobium sp.]
MGDRSWSDVADAIGGIVREVDERSFDELMEARPFQGGGTRTEAVAASQRRIARLRRALEKARMIAMECAREAVDDDGK